MAASAVGDHAAVRKHFQELAQMRLREAKVLLDAGKLEGAYYLAGYAVECGLKACICRRRMKGGVFPDKEFSREVYTHRLEKLVVLADLTLQRQEWTDRHARFGDRWAFVSRWSEDARYLRIVDPVEASEMYRAVAAPKLGVLTWLKKYW